MESNQQGIIKKTNTAVQKESGAKQLKDMVNLYVSNGVIERVLPKVITPERFTQLAMNTIANNKELQKCTPKSFIGALINSAQLGLEPNTPLGQAYLIPYRNGRTGQVDCQFQIGYKGLLDLAYRSGEVSMVDAQTVYENDTFDYELGLNPYLKHKPATTNRGKPVFYYAVVKFKNGGYNFQVMSYDDVVNHKNRYSRAKNSPWNTSFDEMAKKTVLKKALKYAPLRTDFAKQVSEDESIKSDVSEDMSDVPNELFDAEYEVYETDPETGEIKE